jgi:subtilisin family serine protease
MLNAARDGASVINVSLGVCPIDGLPPVAMAAMVDMLDRQPPRGEVTIVAAAGNDGTDHVVYPAAFPSVIGVAAVDSQRQRTPWSNFGPWVRAAARGAWVSSYFGHARQPLDIDGLGTFEGFAEWEGSSFAAPVVTARIAAQMGGGGPARAITASTLAAGTPVAGAGVLVD